MQQKDNYYAILFFFFPVLAQHRNNFDWNWHNNLSVFEFSIFWNHPFFFWKNFSLLSSLLSLSPSRSCFFFFLFLSVFLLGRFPCYHVGSKVVTSHYYCSYYKSAINLLKPAENNSLSNSKCGKYTYGYSNNLGYLKRVLLPPPQIVPIRRHLMGWLSNLISLMSQVAPTKWLFGDQLLLQDLDSWWTGPGLDA